MKLSKCTLLYLGFSFLILSLGTPRANSDDFINTHRDILSYALPPISASLFVHTKPFDGGAFHQSIHVKGGVAAVPVHGSTETLICFQDDYSVAVDDTLYGPRMSATKSGKKVSVWIGKTADYYHILHTDLLYARVHDASYLRVDTIIEAAEQDDAPRVSYLLSRTASRPSFEYDRKHALYEATMRNKADIVEIIIRSGIDVNAADDMGITALMTASLLDRIDIAKMLLQAGARASTVDRSGNTALECATEAAHSDMVALLKQYGATK